MNSMLSRLLTIITGRLSPWIFECTHGLKQTNIQSRWSEFYKYIDRYVSPESLPQWFIINYNNDQCVFIY